LNIGESIKKINAFKKFWGEFSVIASWEIFLSVKNCRICPKICPRISSSKNMWAIRKVLNNPVKKKPRSYFKDNINQSFKQCLYPTAPLKSKNPQTVDFFMNFKIKSTNTSRTVNHQTRHNISISNLLLLDGVGCGKHIFSFDPTWCFFVVLPFLDHTKLPFKSGFTLIHTSVHPSIHPQMQPSDQTTI
jgi:hypothetical protein